MKILSGLYKGEKEDFRRVSPLSGFSMYNPPSWVSGDFFSPIRFIFPQLSSQPSDFKAGAVPGCKGDKQPPPQPEDPERSLDPASQEDPDISVELIDGVFYQLSNDNALVAITADYPGLLPAAKVTETEVPVL